MPLFAAGKRSSARHSEHRSDGESGAAQIIWRDLAAGGPQVTQQLRIVKNEIRIGGIAVACIAGANFNVG